MHELLQFLNRQGVTSFLTIAQHGLIGNMTTPVEVTYLADTVILLRYFEARGHVRRAIPYQEEGRRHEDTIREYKDRAVRLHIRRTARRVSGYPAWRALCSKA